MRSWLPCFFFCLIALLAACSRQPGKPQERGLGLRLGEEYSGPAWHALALLRTGDNPLWFELGPDGPEHIESPGAASLTPFSPWPHARYITGMLAWDGFLVMAANREGFLVLGRGADTGEAFLYQASDRVFWDPYTAESLFIRNGRPAVLLYRNDFFSDPKAPSPKPQVYVLEKASPVPMGEKVPALEHFPPGGPWEAELIRPGPDGLWYFRVKEKEKERGETAFFRAGDLAARGTRISVDEWRNSNHPENPPALLAAVLNQAGDRAALTVSPGFEGQRLFSLAPAGENLALMYAYFGETLALAVTPDGRGFYSDGKETKPFSLPVLPETFVYTGIALLQSDILAASWEEQELPAIGAAGFMVMRFNPLQYRN